MAQSKVAFEKKRLIFREGGPANKLYMIKSGEVLCLKQSKDRLIPIFTAREDDIIGENAMLKDATNAYSAIASSDVEVIEIPSSHFATVLKEAPEWLVELTSTMINRFERTASLIAENRIINSALVDETIFTDEFEVELKRVLDPKPPRS
jgi:CRP-like cAMP-binding protein